MEIYPDLASLPAKALEPVATLGNFDGVHRGHQAILARLQEEAQRVDAETMVITFHPHPRQILDPTSPFQHIMSLKERLRVLWDLDIDHALVIPFDLGFAETTAAEFVEDILWERLRVRGVYVGEYTAFGHGREGNARYLASEGRRLGYATGVVDPVFSGEHRISSSRIRGAIAGGDMDLAARLLGRHHVVAGHVVHGEGRGKDLGFPTANLFTDGSALPPSGVYAAWATLADGARLGALVNIGNRPTFGESQGTTVEAYILDHEGDLYDQALSLAIVRRLRAEVAFPNVDALKAQIAEDVTEGRRILNP